MKAVNKKAQAIFQAAIIRMGKDRHVRIDNKPDIYMALVVERIGFLRHSKDAIPMPLYSFAHYGEQNGDAMRDPDVVMAQAPNGRLYPISFRNDYAGVNQEAIVYGEDGCVKGYKPKMQADIARFCGSWADNLKDQQGLAPAKMTGRVAGLLRRHQTIVDELVAKGMPADQASKLVYDQMQKAV